MKWVMAMRIDVRHRDEKGLHAVVGAVVIFVLTRLWLSGELAGWLALITGWLRGVESSGFSSATYAVVELITSLIYGIGAVAVLAWSGVLWLIRDVAAAVRLWREKQEPVAGPRVVNVDEDYAAAKIVSEPEVYSDPLIDAIETLATAVKDIQVRIEAIETRPEPLAPKATTRRRTNA
jgi:uncharacterized membrane protein